MNSVQHHINANYIEMVLIQFKTKRVERLSYLGWKGSPVLLKVHGFQRVGVLQTSVIL